MSEAVIISLIGAATSLVAAAIAGYVAYKIAGIHKQLNSMRDQENATNRQLGNEEGNREGRAELKKETKPLI